MEVTYGLDDAVIMNCSLFDCRTTCWDEDFLHFVGLCYQCLCFVSHRLPLHHCCCHSFDLDWDPNRYSQLWCFRCSLSFVYRPKWASSNFCRFSNQMAVSSTGIDITVSPCAFANVGSSIDLDWVRNRRPSNLEVLRQSCSRCIHLGCCRHHSYGLPFARSAWERWMNGYWFKNCIRWCWLPEPYRAFYLTGLVFSFYR